MCDAADSVFDFVLGEDTKAGPNATKVTGVGVSPPEYVDVRSGGTAQEGRARKAREEEIEKTREESSNLPDLSDEAIINARLLERRKQLGLSARNSTFLAKDPTKVAPTVAKTLLGQ